MKGKLLVVHEKIIDLLTFTFYLLGAEPDEGVGHGFVTSRYCPAQLWRVIWRDPVLAISGKRDTFSPDLPWHFPLWSKTSIFFVVGGKWSPKNPALAFSVQSKGAATGRKGSDAENQVHFARNSVETQRG